MLPEPAENQLRTVCIHHCLSAICLAVLTALVLTHQTAVWIRQIALLRIRRNFFRWFDTLALAASFALFSCRHFTLVLGAFCFRPRLGLCFQARTSRIQLCLQGLAPLQFFRQLLGIGSIVCICRFRLLRNAFQNA